MNFALTKMSPGYCSQSVYTSVDADRLRFHLYRQRTTIER
jgi:hypothetical protein